MEIISIIGAGSQVVSLTSGLAEIVKSIKASLVEVIQRLQGEAIKISEGFESRLREMLEQLKETGIDPTDRLMACSRISSGTTLSHDTGLELCGSSSTSCISG